MSNGPINRFVYDRTRKPAGACQCGQPKRSAKHEHCDDCIERIERERERRKSERKRKRA